MKLPLLSDIDAIIFDLGMVIINLDMQATFDQLDTLLGEQHEQLMETLHADNVFNLYETGKISTDDFLSALVNAASGQKSKDAFKRAWNAMLLDIPPKRFEILAWAKANFKTYCLSNTNELHMAWIYNMLQSKHDRPNLDAYFHRVYLSHEMNQRKPDVEIFETVIQNHNLNPQRTLFIDDTKGHLVGAAKAGLNTYHLTNGETLEEIMPI